MNSKGLLLPYQHKWVRDKAPVKVWVASRQIGKSFALSLEAVMASYFGSSDNLILSSSERQASEVMRKVKKHVRVIEAFNRVLAPVKDTREEVVFPGGSRIISLPANPDTVRGFSGNVYLDEFAFHQDSRAIWRAMYPMVTRGYKVRITSTPNGKQNMFHDLASGNGGLGQGSMVSRHSTSIHEAVEQGLAADVKALRAGISDPESWAQEFECRFIDTATALLTYEMISACESPDASASQPEGQLKNAYVGVDIGRRHDLTVFWVFEEVGDVLSTRRVHEMRGESFAAQRDALYALMKQPGVRRACIDSTGIGSQLAEEAVQKFGSRVEPVHFTQAVKEDLAIRTRLAFEDRWVRIPSDEKIRRDLHSLGREVTASGSTRFTARRSSAGHADRFWALALALSAAGSWRSSAAPVEYSSLEGRQRASGSRGW